MPPIRSEDDFLALIDRHFPRSHPRVPLHRGDDAAVIACPPRLCLTTDLFLEDVHFRRAYFSPEDAGYKGLAVNVSDVAAMGCRPTGFTLGLFAPHDVDAPFFEGLFAGMAGLAASLDLPLVGGDLDRGASIGLAVTVWGEPGPSGRFLTRQTAGVGDVLFWVGEIGLARVGLTVLEAEGRAAIARWPAATAAHLRPAIRVAQGLALAETSSVTGLMDVSDGLARDLPRFLPPGAGAALRVDASALSEEVRRFAASDLDPVAFAVVGGEDYALLGSCRPADFESVARAVPQAYRLGVVTAAPGIVVNGVPLVERGFDHFG